MKRTFILIAILLPCSLMMGQVTITSQDMPQPGDTIRTSVTLLPEAIDYRSTGENHTWNFSGMQAMIQQVDSFVSITSVPLTYQLAFNNQFIYPDHKATVSRKLTEFNMISGMEITDTYQFFREAGNEFREVGIGVTLSGIPIPILYQQIDTLYRLPLAYGDQDSSHSSFTIDIPDLGYLGVTKHRRNFADGWGTLITPFGEFQTLRVKTEYQEYDSVYIDSLGTGMPVNRQYIEYKWMTNGFSIPLLTVTEENNLATATYIDSLRTSFLGVNEEVLQPDFSFKVYPNPVSEFLAVSYELYETTHVSMSLYSLHGKEVKKVMNAIQEHGLYNQLINIRESGVEPGLYLLILQIDQYLLVKRILIQ